LTVLHGQLYVQHSEQLELGKSPIKDSLVASSKHRENPNPLSSNHLSPSNHTPHSNNQFSPSITPLAGPKEPLLHTHGDKTPKEKGVAVEPKRSCGKRCESLEDASGANHTTLPRLDALSTAPLLDHGKNGPDGGGGANGDGGSVDGDASHRGFGDARGDNNSYFDPSKWRDKPDVLHVVFSTDCSAFQDWQSQVKRPKQKYCHHRGTL
jgi:hypothetical protein